MGKLLHKGFQSGVTIERVSSFSRNVNYFFKLCLDSICRNGGRGVDRGMKWVHVIYAGGDDLFMLGAWNHIAELSAEIANAFRANSRHTTLTWGLAPDSRFTNRNFLLRKWQECP